MADENYYLPNPPERRRKLLIPLLFVRLFTLFENLDEYLFYTLTGKTFVKAGKEGFVELREFLDAHESVQQKILKQTGKDDISKIEPNLEVKKIIFYF